jgi:hypothetical protein
MADSGIKRNIPIKLGDFSVIDTEFSNIRERFDAEMKKMEDEMSRFRSELMNRESNNFFKSTTRFVSKDRDFSPGKKNQMLYLFSFCRKIFVRHLSSFFFSSSSHD